MVQKIAGWLPAYHLYVVGDVAYVGQHVLKGRPANEQVVGPLRWDAALSAPLVPSSSKQRKKGDRLRTPREMLDGEDPRWPQESICLVMPQGGGTKHCCRLCPACARHRGRKSSHPRGGSARGKR